MKGGKWGVREREKRPVSQPSILNGEKASFLKRKAHHFRLLAQKRASVFLSQKVALISPPFVSKSCSQLSAFCLKKWLSSLRLLSQQVSRILCAQVRSQRDFYRSKRRERDSLPVVAIVGYTNAGKSTLLNQLCGSQEVRPFHHPYPPPTPYLPPPPAPLVL